MEPFAHPGLGEAWLAAVRLPGAFVSLMRLIGVSRQVSTADISCYVPLLLGDDGGSAFEDHARLRADRRQATPLPVSGVQPAAESRTPQTIWTAYVCHGRATVCRHNWPRASITQSLPGKHFLQEDYPAEIAEAVLQLTQRADRW
jgi:hypothetical protein